MVQYGTLKYHSITSSLKTIYIYIYIYNGFIFQVARWWSPPHLTGLHVPWPADAGGGPLGALGDREMTGRTGTNGMLYDVITI